MHDGPFHEWSLDLYGYLERDNMVLKELQRIKRWYKQNIPIPQLCSRSFVKFCDENSKTKSEEPLGLPPETLGLPKNVSKFGET